MKFLLKLIPVLLLSLVSQLAFAEYEFLPTSKDHKFETFSILQDHVTSLYYRNGSKAWGSIGAGYALLGNDQLWGKPQLVLTGSLHGALRLSRGRDALLTDTVDARLGPQFNFEVTSRYRFYIAWNHESGHISDNVPDADLIGPNLGNEIIFFRNFYELNDKLLVGGTIRPCLGSDPGMKFWGSDEFFEFYPWGHFDSRKKATPYFATALEQYGPKIINTTQLQAGLYWGSHLADENTTTLRVTANYYNGIDPRMKYAQFKNARASFMLLGFALGF